MRVRPRTMHHAPTLPPGRAARIVPTGCREAEHWRSPKLNQVIPSADRSVAPRVGGCSKAIGSSATMTVHDSPGVENFCRSGRGFLPATGRHEGDRVRHIGGQRRDTRGQQHRLGDRRGGAARGPRPRPPPRSLTRSRAILATVTVPPPQRAACAPGARQADLAGGLRLNGVVGGEVADEHRGGVWDAERGGLERVRAPGRVFCSTLAIVWPVTCCTASGHGAPGIEAAQR